LTLEALPDADAVRTLDHAGIERWVEGLDQPKRSRCR
jgi:hypothetical protein